MKRLTVLVILAVLLAGLILAGLSDSAIYVADTGTSGSEVPPAIGQYQQAHTLD